MSKFVAEPTPTHIHVYFADAQGRPDGHLNSWDHESAGSLAVAIESALQEALVMGGPSRLDLLEADIAELRAEFHAFMRAGRPKLGGE